MGQLCSGAGVTHVRFQSLVMDHEDTERPKEVFLITAGERKTVSESFPSTSATILGSILISSSLLIFILETLCIVHDYDTWFSGFWTPPIFLTAGVFGISAARTGKKYLVVVTLVISVISAVFGFILDYSVLIIWNINYINCYSHCYDEVTGYCGTDILENCTWNRYNSSRPCTNHIGNGSYVDLTSSECMGNIAYPAVGVLGLIIFDVSIALSALACGAVCVCRETSSVMARVQYRKDRDMTWTH